MMDLTTTSMKMKSCLILAAIINIKILKICKQPIKLWLLAVARKKEFICSSLKNLNILLFKDSSICFYKNHKNKVKVSFPSNSSSIIFLTNL